MKSNYSLKNKLNSKWTLWFDDFKANQPNTQPYENNIYTIYSFDTIEFFWRTFNNIPPLSDLPTPSSYHLMKFGIKPLWEDKRNYPGCFTKLRIKGIPNPELFQEAAIFLISLEFYNEYNDEEINGISIAKKEKDYYVLEIWSNKKYEPKNFVASLLKNLKKHCIFESEKPTSRNCSDLVRQHKKKTNSSSNK